MNYKEFENFILQLPRSCATKKQSETQGKLNFEIVKEALSFLAIDLSELKFVHVAGTNGKGSVCTKIAHAIAKSGYLVGLFTSPHLISVRERISLVGSFNLDQQTPIPEEEFQRCGERVLRFFVAEKISCGFFDFLVILAFLWFFEKKVNLVVCEVGIGGRYDSTNFIQPILSVITSISLDHQELLGATLEQIAWHKAGIIKRRVPVVLGPRINESAIFEFAKSMQSDVCQPRKVSLNYEIENRATACEALRYLSKELNLKQSAIAYGLDQVPCGRYQKLSDKRKHLWILDVGHNNEGIARFIQRASDEFGNKRFIIVFSIARDKDYESFFPLLAQSARKIFLVKPENSRLEDPLVLQTCAIKLGFEQTTIVNLPDQIETISLEGEKSGLPVLACGSFLFIAQILKNLR